ncbi:hypothetical protein FHT72_006813 [Rhizobium sp. BK077]|uniref:hypothetical protein n=1 Tax=Rhizobium TaxID=379 RepID=UPI000BE9C2E3|nr:MULTISPECIES: hypothetical protein [Rhizobium]MBB3302856.1 hypothetical protein [Rhizobium sp. BK112]MBB3372277.1 hypothetical protein [Rhizobium sp. BK077]MBB4182716.1 hypothetical protein [Rhizobium sp. BK109]PDS54528.1 hypothetical protein CO663_34670 [Rhizobium anhuiense]
MIRSPRENNRDRALYEFHVACPHPTAAQIIEWTERYPEFAEDIRIHAAITLDWDAADSMGEPTDLPISDTMMARARSRVLNALFQSESEAATREAEPSIGFHEMLEQRGQRVHEVARELGIGRDVLADLFNGWMIEPVGRMLIDAVRGFFGISEATFQRAYKHAFDNPTLQHAKSSGPPIIPRRSYAEIIAGSNMAQERKKYWLGET